MFGWHLGLRSHCSFCLFSRVSISGLPSNLTCAFLQANYAVQPVVVRANRSQVGIQRMVSHVNQGFTWTKEQAVIFCRRKCPRGNVVAFRHSDYDGFAARGSVDAPSSRTMIDLTLLICCFCCRGGGVASSSVLTHRGQSTYGAPVLLPVKFQCLHLAQVISMDFWLPSTLAGQSQSWTECICVL